MKTIAILSTLILLGMVVGYVHASTPSECDETIKVLDEKFEPYPQGYFSAGIFYAQYYMQHHCEIAEERITEIMEELYPYTKQYSRYQETQQDVYDGLRIALDELLLQSVRAELEK